MNMLCISKRLVEGVFPNGLVPGLEGIVPDVGLGDSAVRRNALRDRVTSLGFSVDRCDGTVICTVTGHLHAGDYTGGDIVPTMPFSASSILSHCRSR